MCHFGVLVVLEEASSGAARALNLIDPVGPLSGKGRRGGPRLAGELGHLRDVVAMALLARLDVFARTTWRFSLKER